MRVKTEVRQKGASISDKNQCVSKQDEIFNVKTVSNIFLHKYYKIKCFQT